MRRGKHTDAIKSAVINLGQHANKVNLAALGYSIREIEKAVRDGAIYWTRGGDLRAK